jgi:starch synthase
MQLLYPNVSNDIFNQSRPIYSKETMSAPTRYGPHAIVKNSIIASGAFIEGEVINSVVGRKAHVKKNAKVYQSVLMNHAEIGENAQVDYSVLDKETVVVDDAKVIGSIDKLFVSEKRQIVTSEKDLSILQVSAEVAPYMKTGGLADMVGANAEVYPLLGKKSMVVMPLYPKIQENYHLLLKDVANKSITFGEETYKATLKSLSHNNAVYYFIETYQFFERERIYGYNDDDERFAFFSLAVVEFLEDFESYPDVIHVHDWHSALIPMIIIEKKIGIQTLLTIHNIQYQGVFSRRVLKDLHIQNEYSFIRPTQLNFLEAGIHLADKVSTVSETYKDELSYDYYSGNLVEAIQRRARDLYGILNGISDDIGPKDDLEIAQKYDLVNVFSAKKINKIDLQKRMGLIEDPNAFVIGMVTRIVELKGFDIIIPALNSILENDHIQFVILGTGEENYLNLLKDLKARFPNRVSINLTYDATNPNYIYAGSDLFLMPSRIEPCGLGQMIALKYGTIPLVRQTGGLNDTIDHYDMSSKRGTGFKFYNFDVRDLIFQINNAYGIYTNHINDWHQLIINAMNARFTIKDSAMKYSELYEMMV